ncbi:hypothetical protein B0A50_04634 [Salinomyces thailandicus]|uniref:VPS9 domain-containing protein n=1 Tax=Salinomyces thailandicus TaxID=706561 RepID=A0A4U0TV85_9PEZI|nr:hypothetical protein B0A50_04634 [Salinomyces thailandica]
MSKNQQRSVSDNRPALHLSRSFTRMPPSPDPESPRKRASTMQTSGIPAVPEARHIDTSPELVGKKKTDVFEKHEEEDEENEAAAMPNPELKLPSTFDDLPIEIKSLTERFLDNLAAKIHPTPLTADALSDLFQDFYERAANHIATHIATLAARIGRKKPAATGGKGRTRAGSAAKRGGSPASGGEMLTVDEVAERKKARRLLELKRVALEEAVERGVCERLYERIFKHKSTDDDARDEKLRSRTAALAVVGIGLKELHMDTDRTKDDVRKTAEEKEAEIHASLADARDALQRMDEEHYPAGKLQHLTAAHKSIVETLSQLFPSSSSADEILPTLIYTLITSPPEGINVVSNLNFIQRFRAQSKVDGEAAYCLVNLEAAISFLETVDLSSLRADELPEGPAKSNSRPSTPTSETKPSLLQPVPSGTPKPSLSPLSATTTSEPLSSSPTAIASATSDVSKTPSTLTPPNPGNRPPLQHRRLSSLVQAQADRLEAGREGLLNAADKVYDSINGTLDSSLAFVFGRFKEQAAGSTSLPKTLEEARKLVSSAPTTLEEREEAAARDFSGRSSPASTIDDPLLAAGNPTKKPSEAETKMLELISGKSSVRDRKPDRDHSVDSTRSGGSSTGSKRVNFTDKTPQQLQATDQATTSTTTSAAPGPTALFNAINPLSRFQVPGFARFGGRSASGSLPQTTTTTTGTAATHPPNPPNTDTTKKPLADITESPTSLNPAKTRPRAPSSSAALLENDPDSADALNALEALAVLKRLQPPPKRFLEVESASELRLGEVEELLEELRRVWGVVGEAVG